MKLATIALAGASLLAFATPAAAGDGWYLGLGAGWTKLNQVSYTTTVPGHINTTSTARLDVAAGYKWASGLRLELDSGYANYKVKSATTATGVPIAGTSGHLSVCTLLASVNYDIPLDFAPGF